MRVPIAFIVYWWASLFVVKPGWWSLLLVDSSYSTSETLTKQSTRVKTVIYEKKIF